MARSNHESHTVAIWVAQSRNIANLGRANSQLESRKVATWVAHSLSNGIVVGFFACIMRYTYADCKIIQYALYICRLKNHP